MSDTYRVTHRFIQRGDDRVEAGEEFEPDDVEIDAFGDRLELVDETEDEEPEAESVSFHPSDNTINELEEHIEDVDDLSELEALRAIEEQNDNRAGAKQIIDERIDELEG